MEPTVVRKWIVWIILGACFWCILFTVVTLLMYDGGPLCFLAPKRCLYASSNQNIPLHAIDTTTPKSIDNIPTRTLGPTPTQWEPYTPTPEPTLDEAAIEATMLYLEAYDYNIQDHEVDCGRNPYRYNDVEGNWERIFSYQCYPHTDDPMELIFDGHNYTGASYVLGRLDIGNTSVDYQLEILSELGVWNAECECAVDSYTLDYIITEYEESKEGEENTKDAGD